MAKYTIVDTRSTAVVTLRMGRPLQKIIQVAAEEERTLADAIYVAAEVANMNRLPSHRSVRVQVNPKEAHNG